jgi:3-oxoacyl-[acyl-carrier protein] reductase
VLLEQKVAVVYGGGAIGGAIARSFAAEGARVFLASRTRGALDRIADEIHAHDGQAEIAVLDALDEPAVDGFVDDVADRSGRLDISCDVIGYGDVQQPLMDISAADFLQPITTAARTHFLTTRAAARHMIPRRSGVILAFGGSGPQTLPGLGGFKVALDAVEAIRRQWATELGEHGIRVLSLKSGGVPEGIPQTFPARDDIAATLAEATLLKRTATLSDVGAVAAFLASDRARAITATEVNISCGAIVD